MQNKQGINYFAFPGWKSKIMASDANRYFENH